MKYGERKQYFSGESVSRFCKLFFNSSGANKPEITHIVQWEFWQVRGFRYPVFTQLGQAELIYSRFTEMRRKNAFKADAFINM